MEYDFLFKILTLGDSNVGKSSILCRYVDDYYNENYISTIGVDFKIKTIEVDGRRVKLQIWDTAGQERFRTITKSYYRGGHAILLVFDLSDRDTFNNLTTWMADITNIYNNIVVYLIGNKCDLVSQRQVTYTDASSFAENHGYSYIETSAKNNQGLNTVFVNLTKYLLEKISADIVTANTIINDCPTHSIPIHKCNCN